MKRSFVDVIYTVIAAMLFYLAGPNIFSSQGFAICAWVFAVPLFFAIHEKPFHARLMLGALFSLITYAFILSWVININIFLFVFFSCLFAMQPIVFVALLKNNCRAHPLVNVFFIPSLWVMTEAFRAFVIGGYAWTIGHSQAFNPIFIQIADLAGAYGISFVVLLVNACFYYALKDFKNVRICVFVSIAFLLLVILYGKVVIKDVSSEHVYSICTIQPNISSDEKLKPELIDHVMDKQLALSKKCFIEKKPDLIVWPETSITDDVINDENLYSKIQSFIQKHQVKMLIGSALLIDGKNYNSAVLFDEKGMVKGSYHKQYLLPFNEYFPLRDKLLFLRKIFNLNNYNFQPGEQHDVLLLGLDRGEKFGVAICSEEGYPTLLRRQAANGAAFFIAMLNDAWFKSDAAVMMHAQNGFIQAVTFKKPVIRSTNSGLSCAIDRYGRMQGGLEQDLKLNQQEVFRFNVNLSPAKTFYATFGNVFVFLCSLFSIMILWKKKKGEM